MVFQVDIQAVVSSLAVKVGKLESSLFGADGRLALPGSLHRISRIQDPRTGQIQGLTMRVGRSVKRSGHRPLHGLQAGSCKHTTPEPYARVPPCNHTLSASMRPPPIPSIILYTITDLSRALLASFPTCLRRWLQPGVASSSLGLQVWARPRCLGTSSTPFRAPLIKASSWWTHRMRLQEMATPLTPALGMQGG